MNLEHREPGTECLPVEPKSTRGSSGTSSRGYLRDSSAQQQQQLLTQHCQLDDQAAIEHGAASNTHTIHRYLYTLW